MRPALVLSRRAWMGVGLGLVGLALAAGLLGAARLSWFAVIQDTHDAHLVLVRGPAVAGQTFLSRYPGLTEIRLQATDPFPAADQPVTLTLLDLADGGVAAVVTQPMGAAERGGQLRFVFPPLDNSAGRRYRIELSTAGPEPLTLVGHSQDLYPDGAAQSGGDLMFEARYSGRIGPTLAALADRLTAGRPGLLGQAGLYPGLAAAYLILAGLAVRRVFRAPAAGHSEP